MGALARALKAKYPGGPREALRALGLPEDLLSPAQLASDAKQRARREAAKKGMAIDGGGVLSPDAPQSALAAMEAKLIERYHGEELEEMRELLERVHHQAGVEHDGEVVDEEPDDDPEEETRFFGGKTDEEERARRKFRMRQLADHLTTARDAGGQGLSHNDAAEILRDFPRNELEHMNASVFDEDLESVMERLTGMGGSSTTGYPPKAGDRRKRARDRKQANDAFGLGRLEGRASDMCRYGDQEPPALAYDERSSDAAAEVDSWFGTGRIGIA